MECVPEAWLSQQIMLAIIKVSCLLVQPLALFSWLILYVTSLPSLNLLVWWVFLKL